MGSKGSRSSGGRSSRKVGVRSSGGRQLLFTFGQEEGRIIPPMAGS